MFCQDETALCGWRSAFIGHGSDLDLPTEELPRVYQAIGAGRGVTDLVMMTDAKCHRHTRTRSSIPPGPCRRRATN